MPEGVYNSQRTPSQKSWWKTHASAAAQAMFIVCSRFDLVIDDDSKGIHNLWHFFAQDYDLTAQGSHMTMSREAEQLNQSIRREISLAIVDLAPPDLPSRTAARELCVDNGWIGEGPTDLLGLVMGKLILKTAKYIQDHFSDKVEVEGTEIEHWDRVWLRLVHHCGTADALQVTLWEWDPRVELPTLFQGERGVETTPGGAKWLSFTFHMDTLGPV